MGCFSPLKGYRDAFTGGWTSNVRKAHSSKNSLEVACGQCLGCRLDHSLMWAVRIVHESYLYNDRNGNCFVTLTYRDPWECTKEQFARGEYVPADGSLRPSDVSKFIRRLRKRREQKIRYFYCGEYGDDNFRPHYHLCLFNCDFSDSVVYRDEEGIITYESAELAELWPFGFSTVQELNYGNAAYTARYSLKKVNGKKADDHYLRCDEHGKAYWLLPEYIRMSRGRGKPSGIGAKFYEKYQDEIFPADDVPVPGHGVIRKVPRYYQQILESQRPEVLAVVRELREKYYEAHKAEFTPDRLRQKYNCAKARLRERTL